MNLFIGGVVIDRICRIQRMPEWNEVEYISGYSNQQGGMAATAAVACARLGEKAEFIGGIGDDDNGKTILENFQLNNVISSRVKIFPGQHSAFSICLVHDGTGERTILHHKAVQNNSNLFTDINLSGIKNIHIDGYWFDTVLPLLKQAVEKNINVVIDPSTKLLRNKNECELLNYADYIMPNYKFASMFTNETDPKKICLQLYRDNCKAVIITHGENGCYVYDKTGFKHVDAFKINAVDTTGAGDVFHGAFVAGLSKNFSLEYNCIFASAVSAIKCTHAGGQLGIPELSSVIKFITDSKNH